MVVSHLQQPCPCGTGATYDSCCGPLLANTAQATSPEQLMRSRYTRTWHPRTRPEDLSLPAGVTWTGLEILGTRDGARTTRPARSSS